MNVVVADDHEVIRIGTVLKLKQAFPDATIAEATDFGDFEANWSKIDGPDLAIVDLKMPDGDWRHALGKLRSARPRTRIVVMSGLEHAGVIREILPEFADGFVPKSADAQTLLHAVSVALDGGTFVPVVALAPATPTVDQNDGEHRSDLPLTARQQDVLRLIADGKPNKLIAHELGLSIGTVKIHVSNILSALGARNRTEATVMARRHLRRVPVVTDPEALSRTIRRRDGDQTGSDVLVV